MACICNSSVRKWKQGALTSLAYLVSSKPGKDSISNKQKVDSVSAMTSEVDIWSTHTCMYTNTYLHAQVHKHT